MEEDGDEEDTAPVRGVIARVDFIIDFCRRGESQRGWVLLLEHKSPCVLELSDWIKGIGNGTGALYRNAVIVSKQARKYMAAGHLNMIAIYDSLSVVGVSLKWEIYPEWASKDVLEGKVFFEDRRDMFLPTLIALITMSLETKGFI